MTRLYGRADLIDRAGAAVERALAGEGRSLLFTGEPGIGKSTLAEFVATTAAARGATVAWGRCWEVGGAPAYWPWIQVLGGLGMDPDPFVGALSDVTPGAGEDRFAAFERTVRAVKARAAQGPLALIFDDLHAADAPSLLLLLLLVRALRGARILVVGAYRDAEARLTPEVASALAKITRESDVLPLPRLQAVDVAAWALEAGAGGGAVASAELYRLTEGHPLFVVEALRLGEEGRPRFLAGLGAALDEHLGRLSAGTRRVLEAAAVLGRDFSLADVAAVAGVALDPVHAALAEAIGLSVVRPTAEPASFRFAHDLLRERLHRELAPSARGQLHLRAAGVMRAGGAQALASAAHHLFEGHALGAARWPEVAEMALAAAEAALRRLAFEDAARLARRALDLRAAPNEGGGDGDGPEVSPDRMGELRLTLAESLIRLGEDAEGKALCVLAAESAERAASPTSSALLARAALVYGTELASGSVDPQMLSLLRRALARLDGGDSAPRARLMARLAAALTPPADPASARESLELMRAASAMARRLGDRNVLLYVLQYGATVALLVPDDERLASLRETVQLASALDQRLVLLQTLPAYITALLAHGAVVEAEGMVLRLDAALADVQQPLHRVRGALVHALFCLLRGDFEAADRLSAEARAIAGGAGGVGSDAGIRLWLVQRLSFAIMRGRPDLLTPDEAEQIFTPINQGAIGAGHVAFTLLGMGRRADAVALLRKADLAAHEIPWANLLDLLGAAETAALLGDEGLAATIYPRLVRASDRMFWHLAPGALIGPTARSLGDLALLLGRASEAVRHYDEAIAACRALGASALVDVCLERRTRALAPAGARPIESAPAGPAVSPGAPVVTSPAVQLRREGDLWAVTAAVGRASPLRLKHAKGVGYLHYLIEQTGREVHVLELIGVDHPVGDAGPVLDARAKQEYRRRLDDLRDQQAEAERFEDPARAARISGQIEALAAELAGAVGLGGRDRRAASAVERTRINVQRCLKDTIERIAALDPALGRYLAATVKSGTYCAFTPL